MTIQTTTYDQEQAALQSQITDLTEMLEKHIRAGFEHEIAQELRFAEDQLREDYEYEINELIGDELTEKENEIREEWEPTIREAIAEALKDALADAS